jgi:cytosine/adenosine deaminase-related metal-dependent hydrolase
MGEVLIRNGYVLTLDDNVGARAHCDVLIRGDTIEKIGPGLHAPEAEVVDATGMIVMPGLVNAHMHTWQTGMRGIAGDWTLFEYGRRMHAGMAGACSPEDIYIATLVGALNQIDTGVTTLFDWCHNNPTPAHSDRAIDALQEAGIRAVFGHGTPKPKLNEGGVPTEETLHPRDEVDRIRTTRLADDQALVTMALCIRGPDLASLEACQHDIDLARHYGLIASMHIGGRMLFNRRTRDGTEELASSGHLGPHLNIVHGNKLTDRELELLCSAGASFTMTPEVEMQMGHGLPLTGRIMKLGRQPSIGIDVETNIGSNLLQAARFALQVQRGLDNAAINEAGREVEQTSIPCQHALRWATIEGAKAIRMEDRIGSLSPGKQADIILIRSDDLNNFPCHDPVETVLFHAEPGNIDTVLVAGKMKKRDGKLLFDDLANKKRLLADSGERILRSAGIGVSNPTREEA